MTEALGVDIDSVEVVHGDTGKIPFGMGTYGSRSLAVGGMAIMAALEKIKAKSRKIAAHLLEASADDIEFADGKLTVAGTDRPLHAVLERLLRDESYMVGLRSGPGGEPVVAWLRIIGAPTANPLPLSGTVSASPSSGQVEPRNIPLVPADYKFISTQVTSHVEVEWWCEDSLGSLQVMKV